MSLTSLAFVAAFFGGLLASLLRNPVYGLYTYISVFYLHPPDRWWGEMLPDLRWSLLAAFVTVLSLWRDPPPADRPSWLQNSTVRMFILFSAWLWLQLAWAADRETHSEAAILFTKYTLLIFLVYMVVRTAEDLRNVLLVHVLGCFYLGWIIFVTPDSGRLDGRFDGVGGPGIDDANSLAMQLGTGLLAASALVLQGSWRVRALALAVTPFIVNGMIQTMSRGPVVGLIAGGLVMLTVTPVRFRKVYYGLGVLALLILVRMAPAQFWERLGTISAPVQQTEEVDLSTQTRLVLAEAQLQMALDHPFGAGHRGTAILSPRYLDEKYMAKTEWGEALGTRSSHNTFLSVLVEQGMPGALIYLLLLLTVYRQVRQLKTLDPLGLPEAIGTYRAAVAGCITAVLVGGLFTDFLKAEVFVWCLGLLAALYQLAPHALPAAAPPAAPEPDPAPAPPPRRRSRPGRPAVRHRRQGVSRD